MRAAVVLSLALWLPAGSALATTITFEVTGTIGDVVDTSGGVLAGQGIVVGTPFTGSFTYTTGLPDENPGDPTEGSFSADPLGDLFAISMSVGGHVVSSDPASSGSALVLHPGPVGDLIQLTLQNGTSTLGLPILVTEAVLQSTSASVLSSDTLPETLDLADWDSQIAEWDDSATIGFAMGSLTDLAIVQGSIETLTKVVPEPALGLLLALGIALTASAGRRHLEASDQRDTGRLIA